MVLGIIGAISVMLWGITHIFPTKSVVRGFGGISRDNKYILTMEWINEGLALVFIGVVVIISSIWGDGDASLGAMINIAASCMLLAMAALSLFTGFKVKFIPFRLCPFIFTASAILILIGTFI